MFCLEVSFVKALPVFGSSVTVSEAAQWCSSGQASLSPGGIGAAPGAEGALQAGTLK